MSARRTATPDCDGLVLAGGRGRRLGGRDKGLQPVAGATAAARAAGLLRPLCRQLYLSANRHLDAYAQTLPDARLLPDLRPGFPGPLAALEAAQAVPTAPLLLLLACDLPLLSPTVPALLLRELRDEADLDVVCAAAGDRAQYLCAALRRRALAAARWQLDAGEPAVHGWIAQLRHRALPLPPALAPGLRNFNSTADWATLCGD